MSSAHDIDLARINAELGRDAAALTRWALGLGKTTIVTTNFRPYEAVILHLVTRVAPDVPVIWMDNGYNTEATYRYAEAVTQQLGLNPRPTCRCARAPTARPSTAPRPRWTTHATPPSRKS